MRLLKLHYYNLITDDFPKDNYIRKVTRDAGEWNL